MVSFRARMSEIFEKAQVSAHEFTSEGVSGFPDAKDGSSLGVVGDDIFKTSIAVCLEKPDPFG